MSKELADRLEHGGRTFDGGMFLTAEFLQQVIAALRSEPVAEVAGSFLVNWLPDPRHRLPIGTKLYAAPSREDQRGTTDSEKSVQAPNVGQPQEDRVSVPHHQRSEAERVGSPQPNSGTQSSDHPSRTDRQEPTFHCPTCDRDVTSPCSSADCATPEFDKWPTAEPGLSAEQLEFMKKCWSHVPTVIEAIDMALRSLTARDEGIEAAVDALKSRAKNGWVGSITTNETEQCILVVKALKEDSHD